MNPIKRRLPKDVVEVVEAGKRLPPAASPDEMVTWLVSHEAMSLMPVQKYISFLKLSYELSLAIAVVYDLQTPRGTAGKKEHLRHTGPDEMFCMANALYVLSSFGVEGCVLECGASHGYSTCCLSHFCALLGRQLYAADSFEGLPRPSDSASFFARGDYAAALEDVRSRVSMLGRPDHVLFLKGWFAESLKNWHEPVSLLWVDVDLYESARDVIEPVHPFIDRRGVIFTHEFTDFDDKPFPPGAKHPPNALYEVLGREKISYRTAHLLRYFGAIGFETTVQFDALAFSLLLLKKIAGLDWRMSLYDELRNSRTVRAAFALKKLLKFRTGSKPLRVD